ncbi:MAG: Ig-like domain-containing protein [bacterium]
MPMRFFKRGVEGVLLLGLIYGLVACNQNSPMTPAPTTVQPTLASIQSNVFNLKCAVANCHTSTGIAPFSLESGLAYSNLVNAGSAYGNPRLLRVKPNDAANSSLYLKLLGGPITGGPQARMPAGLGPMPINEINAIRDWINAGALPDTGAGIVNSVRIIRPINPSLQVGATLDLNAQAFDANNNPISAIFRWSSNAPVVATVDSISGLVTGVSIGLATITATASGLSDTLGVTVVAAPPLQATLSSIQALIFTPKCVNAGCHPGGGAPMSLADTTTSFTTLVNVNSAQFGRPRVAPGNANNSVLYLKVIADPSVGRGMPVVGAPLSKAETDSIAAWINRGALKN